MKNPPCPHRIVPHCTTGLRTSYYSHLELETNTRVRAEMERMGGQVSKCYRIYRKDLGVMDEQAK
jgi:hypothetical protein